ncbi:MAG: hypothetical protein IPH06_07295 [Alphaproteobacteria bacterium]|jgi:hypothetical protein|nr:hypothetical protein [Alphaproteobacteria bacterium]QQS57819.1 MAG: hypothetical protein IPN28_03055 [Alphaproteobacteria bacterium]
MTTNADHFKNLRNVLLAERERLGITVSRDGIGAPSSSGPINAGMSEALEQLVLLAQLHAGRTEDNITRGYSEANIALVRQYMKDRGVGQDRNDLFTGTIQALDTVASGQQESVFDQQYIRGPADFEALKGASRGLLANTAKGSTVPAARPLSALFAAAAPAAPAAAASTPAAPAVTAQSAAPALPTRRVERTYTFDEIQAIKAKDVQSEEEKAALQAWTAQWRVHANADKFEGGKSYMDIYNARERAKSAYDNRITSYNELGAKIRSLGSQNETLLNGLKDKTMTLTVDGQTYRMSWNDVQAKVGYWEFNDSAFETKLRQAANRGLDGLKQSEGYNDRATEIATTSRQMATHMTTLYQGWQQAERSHSAAFADIRNDPVKFSFNVTDYNAQPTTRVAATTPQ